MRKIIKKKGLLEGVPINFSSNILEKYRKFWFKKRKNDLFIIKILIFSDSENSDFFILKKVEVPESTFKSPSLILGITFLILKKIKISVIPIESSGYEEYFIWQG